MSDSLASPAATDAFIIVSGIIGILFAIFQFKLVSRISLTDGAPGGGNQAPLVTTLGVDTSKLVGIYEAIREGADSFLRAEYTICAYFLLAFGLGTRRMIGPHSRGGRIQQNLPRRTGRAPTHVRARRHQRLPWLAKRGPVPAISAAMAALQR